MRHEETARARWYSARATCHEVEVYGGSPMREGIALRREGIHHRALARPIETNAGGTTTITSSSLWCRHAPVLFSSGMAPESRDNFTEFHRFKKRARPDRRRTSERAASLLPPRAKRFAFTGTNSRMGSCRYSDRASLYAVPPSLVIPQLYFFHSRDLRLSTSFTAFLIIKLCVSARFVLIALGHCRRCFCRE